MGSIFAEKALYGSDAVTTNPAKSDRASGSAFRGMRTASCDFIFATVRSSAVQDRSISVDGARCGLWSIPTTAVHPERPFKLRRYHALTRKSTSRLGLG